MEKSNLTENQKSRITNISYIQGTAGLLGAIGGVMYAKKTGGGFWRYVGYWILGGLIVGLPVSLITVPMQNKILQEGDKNKEENKTK